MFDSPLMARGLFCYFEWMVVVTVGETTDPSRL
jgi:hypothetical protein